MKDFWRFLLGTTPEKRRYNIAVLIGSSLFLIALLGVWVRSIILILIGCVGYFVFGPISITMREKYAKYFYKQLWRLITGRKSHEKEESE